MWLPSISVFQHGAFVFAGLLVYVVATRADAQRRHPSAALAWVVAIVAFPYLATPLFLVFGRRKFVRPIHHAVRAPVLQATHAPQWATSLLAGLGVPAPVGNQSVQFHPDGATSLQALLDLIGGARRNVVLGTFLLGADEVGHAVSAALVSAARRGVHTRVLIDAVGSFKLPSRMLRGLQAGGVEVRLFMPLLHNPRRGRTNLRNHRKLAVTDGSLLWSGGRNLAVEYFLSRPAHPVWIDLSFAAAGPVAAQALAQFETDWGVASGRMDAVPPAEPASEQPAPTHPAAAMPVAPSTGQVLAQWVPSGPDQAEDTVHALLLTAAYHARVRILAVTPYFVPDDALLDAWCMACHRGVQVSLVLPRQSNHVLADWARERALRRLVACGAHVWLVPGMVHAKAVVIDSALALCGSVNLDGRSLFLNYEVMTAFYGPAEVAWLANWHAELAAQALPYRAQQPAWWRDLIEGVVRSVGFQL